MEPLEFEAELWHWDARKADTWTFVSVPAELSEEIRDRAAALPPAGFGSVRVAVTIGAPGDPGRMSSGPVGRGLWESMADDRHPGGEADGRPADPG